VPPVREVVQPGENGLVEPLFDVDRLTESALRVLADPAEYAPLGRAASQTIEQYYSLEVSIPPLAAFLDRVANEKRS
jgi:glycosyltransferase involved in cell wall biosynthesis